MSAISDYLEAKLLNHVFRTTAYTAPTTCYLALFTGEVSDAWTATDKGKEISGHGYARVAVTFSAPTDLDGGKVVANEDDLFFAAASGGAWDTITHAAVIDAETLGNSLYAGPLAIAKTIGDGDRFEVLVGNLKLTLS